MRLVFNILMDFLCKIQRTIIQLSEKCNILKIGPFLAELLQFLAAESEKNKFVGFYLWKKVTSFFGNLPAHLQKISYISANIYPISKNSDSFESWILELMKNVIARGNTYKLNKILCIKVAKSLQIFWKIWGLWTQIFPCSDGFRWENRLKYESP